MIQIKNTGNVVSAKFELFGWTLSLDTPRTHELDAIVLSKTMRDKMENRFQAPVPGPYSKKPSDAAPGLEERLERARQRTKEGAKARKRHRRRP